MNAKYQLYCCGSRGSRPVEGIRFNEFGGFTTCYVLKSDDYALIIDCGTGLYEANPIILDCSVVDVVLTHMHYDHLLGMLDWDTFNQKTKITFYGGFDKWFGDKTFDEFFKAPFWPVQPSFVLKNTPSHGERLVLRNDLYLDFFDSPHPNDCQRMIIHHTDDDGKDYKIAIMFDNEYVDGIDMELLDGCDYILFDGMYTDSEYPEKTGYGHSTWQEGARFATRVNPKRMIITHHNPFRTDEELRSFESKSRDIFPATDFARSGQHWDFPNTDSIRNEEPKEKKKRRFNLDETLNEIVLNKERFARFLSIGTNIILCVVSALMSIVNIYTDKILLMYSTVIFSVLCCINAVAEYKNKKLHNALLLVFQVEMLLLIVFFIVTGTPEGFSAIWALLLPVAGILVFGRSRTLVLSVLMEFLLIFFFETPLGRSYLMYEYTESFMLRFPMAFLAFTLMGLFLGTVREKLSNEVDKVREEQATKIANQTAELRAQYFDLIRANSKLRLRNKMLQGMTGEDISDESLLEMLRTEDGSDYGNES